MSNGAQLHPNLPWLSHHSNQAHIEGASRKIHLKLLFGDVLVVLAIEEEISIQNKTHQNGIAS